MPYLATAMRISASMNSWRMSACSSFMGSRAPPLAWKLAMMNTVSQSDRLQHLDSLSGILVSSRKLVNLGQG